MASATTRSYQSIQIKHNPEPEGPFAPFPLLLPKPSLLALDPRDPENFLKRCSGYSKKTNLRCSAVIGKKTQKDIHPTFLPTCAAHRDQQSLAGWCQFRRPDGQRCARLLRWTPPYLELCDHHCGHPGIPCYFLERLPLELRHEIYQYLTPTEPIGSSAAVIHHSLTEDMSEEYFHLYAPAYGCHQPRRSSCFVRSKFPMRLVNLLCVSRQVYDEVKDFFFRTVTFKIDVRKDGTFMCGRRLLEPQRADGSSHLSADEADHAKRMFLNRFAWASVKNYTVDILLENWLHSDLQPAHTSVNALMDAHWDEEVEIYDIRDYISVVVSGILSKAKKLHKLQVRLCLAGFDWEKEKILSATKLLFGPFERLRNVRQPSIGGLFKGIPNRSSICMVRPRTACIGAPLGYPKLCSVPPLPTSHLVIAPGVSEFDVYSAEWKRQISSEASKNMIQVPSLQKMFTQFRNFYTDLAKHVPDVKARDGRHSFLHRARVAREQEDVIAFRSIRTELLNYWDVYLEIERQKKQDMETRIARFLASDMYPSHVWNEPSPKQQHDSLPGRSVQSPVIPDSNVMAQDGISMPGNSVQGYDARQSYVSQPVLPITNQYQQQSHFHQMSSNVSIYGSQPSGSTYQQKLQQQAQRRAQQQQQQQARRQNREMTQTKRHSTLSTNNHANINNTDAHPLDNSPSTMANTPSISPLPHYPAHAPEETNAVALCSAQTAPSLDEEEQVALASGSTHVPPYAHSSSLSSWLPYDAPLVPDGEAGPSTKKRRLDAGHVDADGDAGVAAWCFGSDEGGHGYLRRGLCGAGDMGGDIGGRRGGGQEEEGQGKGQGRRGREEWYIGKGKGKSWSS